MSPKIFVPILFLTATAFADSDSIRPSADRDAGMMHHAQQTQQSATSETDYWSQLDITRAITIDRPDRVVTPLYSESITQAAAPQAVVVEPAALPLFAAGLLALLQLRRRRQII